MSGETVQAPEHPQHIADLWFAHNEILALLGAADRIAVTVDSPANQPWLFRLEPALKKARYVTPGAASPEGLLADRADLVFVASSLTQAGPLRQAGLPVLDMNFQDVDGLLRCIALTADALNDPVARARADQYRRELSALISEISSRISALSEVQKPRVLHIMSFSPLRVDGGDTMIDQWIRIAGGRNAAASLSGGKKPVTPEQIQAWDPDVIIVQGGVPVPAGDGGFAGWSTLRAVKERRVYANPAGVFPWDRYGAEFLLQIWWAASTLHPDLFSAESLKPRMKDFYRTYFDHALSDEEAALILAGKPPAGQ